MQLFSATIARGRVLGQYLRRHRAKSFFFLLLLSIGLFAVGQSVHAQAGIISEQAGFFNQMLALVSQIILALARICISLTLFALKFFIELAKYNGYIDAPPVIIGWIMVRDLANMFFIVVLLVIAFGTILGLEQYEWKKALAKLVMAAVLLNFSKLIAQLIIDVAHVFTMTFLNALSATAGGNIINMFHLQGMMSLLAADPGRLSSSDLRLDIFAASVLALVFAAMAMVAMGAYVIVMVLRVVVLWVLIIISPAAYLLSILPNTESYASEYWNKFIKHVIAAPIMVFFLWLSFATIGSGNIGTQIGLDLKGNGNVLQNASGVQQSVAANPSTSLLEISTWENMGSFIIAIVFMILGIKMVGQLGVEGGDLAGGAIDFAKKVGTIASGYAAGRFLVGGAVSKTAEGLGAAAGGIVKWAPVIGTERIKTKLATEGQAIRAWYYGQGAGLEINTLQKQIGDLEKAREKVKDNPDEVEKIDKEIASKFARQQKLERQGEQWWTPGGFVGWRARAGIEEERRMKKAEKLADQRREIIWKRTESESGGFLFGNGGALRRIGLGDDSIRDQDRYEKGLLQVEEERSDAKTAEMAEEGLQNALQSSRIQGGQLQRDKKDASKYGESMASQIVGHEERKSTLAESVRQIREEAKQEFQKSGAGAKNLTKKAEFKVKADIATEGAHLAEGGAELAYFRNQGRQLLQALQGLKVKGDLEHRELSLEEAEARNRFIREDDHGDHLLEELNMTDQATDAAEAFLKTRKNELLEEKFKQAAGAINTAIENGTLADLDLNNVYIAALRQQQLASKVDETLKFERGEAESAASSAFVEMPAGGYSTKSTAMISMSKRVADGLQGMTSQQLGRVGADNFAKIAELLATPGATLDTFQQAFAFGTFNHINGEANVDDIGSSMASLVTRLRQNDPNMSADDRRRAENLQRVFGNGPDGLGIIDIDDATGKAVYRSDGGHAATLQAYAVSGGDVDFIKKHRAIEQRMKADGITDYQVAATTELGADGWEDYRKKLVKNQTLITEATGSFLQHGLTTGHLQNAGNQIFDAKLGIARLSTEAEAKDIQEANVRKRGSKVAYQYHSLGRVNTDNGILEYVDTRTYGNTIGQTKKTAEIKNMQDRTMDGLLGYAPSQKRVTDGDVAVLGASDEDILARYGKVGEGIAQAKARFVAEVLLPQVSQSMESFALTAWRKFGGDERSAQAGKFKIKIGDSGEEINQDNIGEQLEILLGADLLTTTDRRQNFGDKTYGEVIEELKQTIRERGARPAAAADGGGVDDSDEVDDTTTGGGGGG